MTTDKVSTLQSNIKQNNKDLTQYGLFLGGLNATHKSLAQIDPLRTNYGRIFFVRMPKFMEVILAEKTKYFKHLLEYGFTDIEGLNNPTLEMEQLTAGYNGKQMDVASIARDDTNEITVRLYETAGSPVREYLNMWISGISDFMTGLGHYHGAMDFDETLTYSQANHIAEAIYVQTDPTGRETGIEYACLLTNMMPKSVKTDHFNHDAGSHPIVQMDIPFSCVKYESPDINIIAKKLVGKYKILTNYMNFKSGYTPQFVDDMPESTITT